MLREAGCAGSGRATATPPRRDRQWAAQDCSVDTTAGRRCLRSSISARQGAPAARGSLFDATAAAAAGAAGAAAADVHCGDGTGTRGRSARDRLIPAADGQQEMPAAVPRGGGEQHWGRWNHQMPHLVIGEAVVGSPPAPCNAAKNALQCTAATIIENSWVGSRVQQERADGSTPRFRLE